MSVKERPGELVDDVTSTEGGIAPCHRTLLSVDVGFAVFCAAVAVVRLLVLVHPAAPAGIDSGNWLALGHDLLGGHLRSRSIVYPPLVPLLVSGAVHVFGLVYGVALVSATTSLMPAIGVYLVLRAWCARSRAALLAGLLATASATGEAAAWGGFPQLIGLGLVPVLLATLDRFLRTGRLRHAVWSGVVLGLIVATSHLILLAAVLSATALLGLHVVLLRHEDAGLRPRAVVWGAIAVVAPTLPFVPLYLTLVTDIHTRPGAQAGLVTVTAGNLVSNVDFLFRDFAVFWRVAITLACVTPLVLWERRRSPPWMLSTSVLAGTAVVVVVTRQPRFLYVLPIAAVLALALWVREAESPTGRLRDVRGPLSGLLAVVLAVQCVLGLEFFRLQRRYYGVLTPATVSGLDWLRTDTPSDATVAVSTAHDEQMLGWWAEAIGQRRTLYESRLVWLNFRDEIVRASQANALFAPPFPSGHTMALAQEDGVDYIFVAKSWPGYATSGLARLRLVHPGAVVFENSAVLILRPYLASSPRDGRMR